MMSKINNFIFRPDRRKKRRDLIADTSQEQKKLISAMNLKTLDLTQEDLIKKYNLIVNLPTEIQQILYLNDIYLLEDKETKKKILLVHFLNKINIKDIVDSISFDEIQYATDATIKLFMQKHSKVGKTIDEHSGATDFVESLLRKAKAVNASDIYISLFDKDLIVQLRTSLGSQEVARFGLKEAAMLRNTLEFMATEENGTRWYDNKIVLQGEEYRINFYETIAGWDATIRNYSSDFGDELTLEVLGYTKKQIALIEDICLNQNGIVLYTAQTGQGKTTTQYANLQWLQKRGLKIVTAEAPVEKKLYGVNQIDLTAYETAEDDFKLDAKKAIKLFLRAKPDIINMGEIRDAEDALNAYTASITGHLVLGTLHTNSVYSAVTRLIHAKLDIEDIKSTVRGIIHQHLTRQLCPHCKIKADNNGHYKANEKGCPECRCGYSKLRTPIAEIAQFPYNKDFDIKDTNTYQNYLSLEDSAKEKYDMGIIDEKHYTALITGQREPSIFCEEIR